MNAAPPRLLDLPVERSARWLAVRFVADARAAARRLADARDDEALHDVRVALRRLRGVLRTYRAPLDAVVRRGDRRRLKRWVRSTGAARDAEVGAALLARVAACDREGARLDPAAARLREALEEEAAGPDVTGLAASIETHGRRLAKRWARLEGRVTLERPEGGPRLRRVLAGRLDDAAVSLRGRLAGVMSVGDRAEAHRARIAARRLRDLLEPFAAHVPGAEPLVGALRDLQDALGEMRDADLLLERIGAERRRAGEAEDGFAAPAERLRELRGERFESVRTGWLDGRAGERLAPLAGVRAWLAEADPPPGLPVEIERKYLLRRFPRLPRGAEVREIDQGWLPGDRLLERVRRVRGGGRERWLRTVKLGAGVARIEVEEETTEELFRRLWKLTRGRRVRKRRYVVRDGELTWEVDRFAGGRRGPGIVLAEVELPAEDHPVVLPDWLHGVVEREVTGDPRYLNVNLAR